VSGGLAVALRELARLPQVWRAPKKSPAELEERALAGLNAMLAYCNEHIPAYAGAEYKLPLSSVGELAALPLLTKRDVLDAGVESFRTPGLPPSQYRVDLTSGTTGTKLEVWHDADAYGYHGATVLRRFLLSGYRPWWQIAHIKPFPRPVRWFQRLGLFPRTVVGAGQSDEEIKNQVLAVRPQLIMGYPVVLRGLLRSLTSAESTRLKRTLRMVMTDSELLTDEVAGLLADGFGVPVLDEYSAYEVLTVSSECRSGAMHVDDDRVWLEIVDADGQPVPLGTEGSVVVTHYRERAMPLIRYALGDRAVLLPAGCACGSNLRRMKLVDGRTNDFILLPGGRRVYSGVFLSLAMFTPGVAECMVRQDSAGAITVHLVPEVAAGVSFDEAVAEFRRRFGELVDAPVELTFVQTDRVALTPGGKGRFVESAYGG
jgi:phenylacetate-CoA ligase